MKIPWGRIWGAIKPYLVSIAVGLLEAKTGVAKSVTKSLGVLDVLPGKKTAIGLAIVALMALLTQIPGIVEAWGVTAPNAIRLVGWAVVGLGALLKIIRPVEEPTQ